jgi:hypothetical protein
MLEGLSESWRKLQLQAEAVGKKIPAALASPSLLTTNITHERRRMLFSDHRTRSMTC